MHNDLADMTVQRSLGEELGLGDVEMGGGGDGWTGEAGTEGSGAIEVSVNCTALVGMATNGIKIRPTDNSQLPDLLAEEMDSEPLYASSPVPATPKNESRRSSLASPSHRYTGQDEANDTVHENYDAAVAERFKYVICSSGLLDKDFLGDRHEPEPTPPATAAVVAKDGPRPLTALLSDAMAWAKLARERWDISLAGLVLVVAVMVVIGWKRVLLGVAAVGGGVAAGIARRSRTQSRPEAVAPQAVVNADSSKDEDYIDHFLATSRLLDTSLRASLSLLEPSPAISFRKDLRSALHRSCDALNDHLADTSSALAPLVDKGEFKVLANMYDIPLGRRKMDSDTWSADHDLLHRPAGSSEADARRELGFGAIPSPRRDTVDRFFSPPSTVRPARPRSMVLAPVQTSWDMAVSQSMPPDTPMSSGHSRHLSLLPSLPVRIQSATPQTDRFTSIPRRTPRLSKRASWDPDAWRRARQVDPSSSNQLSAPIAISSRAPQPSYNQLGVIPAYQSLHTPKRTSPLTGRSHEMPSRPSLTESALRMAALGSTGSPSASSSKRTSLQTKLGMADNPKRRSLQSLTYFPADASDMLRTASSSTTVSDLQQARERASDGDRRRRASMRSNMSISSIHSLGFSAANSPPQDRMGGSFPPGPMSGALPRYPLALSSAATSDSSRSRVASLSPLTHPALQAACLGAHLRRRRVACGLLALNWDHEDEAKSMAYWHDVETAVKDLTARMQTAVETLKAACKHAEEEEPMTASPASRLPPWREHAAATPASCPQWAPKTTDEEHLSDRVLSIQRLLEGAWTATSSAQTHLSQHGLQDEAALGQVERVWVELQKALGEMSREVGLGKAILRDRERALAAMAVGVENQSAEASSSSDDQGYADDLPDFVQSWDSDGHTARSTSIGTVISEQHDPSAPSLEPLIQANTEDLPAVGKDEVFEALIAPEAPKRGVDLSGLSRGERIALTKKAREMGLTLKELLAAGSANAQAAGGDDQGTRVGMDLDMAAVQRKQADKVAQLARLGLVDELRGMMGEIQRRKER